MLFNLPFAVLLSDVTEVFVLPRLGAGSACRTQGKEKQPVAVKNNQIEEGCRISHWNL